MLTTCQPLTKSCYVSAADLNEVLTQYFAGTLDYFTDLSRLWLPPALLNPNNALWGQLDNDDIYGALDGLTSLHKASIEQEYRPSDESYQYLVECFALSNSTLIFYEWRANELRLALENLSEILLKLL